ncbi:MAG: hypothetical protein HUU55_15365 [Myxococcales bacterium]|nr:hypothetical protein [Myxococcales bacterium]
MSSHIIVRIGIFAVFAVSIGVTLVHLMGKPQGGATESRPSFIPQAAQPSAHTQPSRTMSRIQTAALRSALSAPVVAMQPELFEGPLEILPPDTVAAIVLPSWADTANLVDLSDMLEQFRGKLTELDETLADCGIDMSELLDPSTLGIDPHGPVVFAWLDVRETTALIGFRVQDAALFEQTIGNVLTYSAENSGNQFRTEQQGDAVVTFDAQENARLAIVRRPGIAFIAIHESWRGDVETAAAQLAWQDSADSLTNTDIWNDTMHNVHGRHGLLFVNFPAITQQAAFALDEEQKQWEQPGGTPEDDEWQEMQRNRHYAARNLLEAVVGSFRGFGAAVDVSGARVDLDARVLLAADSFLNGFVRNRTLLSPLQKAFREKPIFWLDGALDPTKFRELVQMVAMLGGGDPDEMMKMAAAAMGIEGNPLDLLDGGLGFALFQSSDEHHRQEWGFTASIGIGDMEQARIAFERASAMANVALGSLDDTDDSPTNTASQITTIPIPGWRNLHAGLTAESLVITTDIEVLTRLLDGENSAISSWGIRNEVASMLSGVGEAGSMMLDFSFVRSKNNPSSMVTGGYTEEPPPDASAQQRELWEIDRKLDDAHRQVEEDSAESRNILSDTLGALALTARGEGPAIAVRGVWAFGASDIREAATKLATSAWTLDEITSRNNEETSKLYQRRWEVQESIQPQNGEPAIDPECVDPNGVCTSAATAAPYYEE